MEEILNLTSNQTTEIIVDSDFREKAIAYLRENFRIAIVNSTFWGKDYIPLSREVKKIPSNTQVIVLDSHLDFHYYGMRKMTLKNAFPQAKIILLIKVDNAIKDMRGT